MLSHQGLLFQPVEDHASELLVFIKATDLRLDPPRRAFLTRLLLR